MQSTEPRKIRHIRMRDDEWEKFKRIGGAPWLREKIRKAREPKE